MIGLAAILAAVAAAAAVLIVRMNLAKRPPVVCDTGEGLAEFTWHQYGGSLAGQETYSLICTGETDWTVVHAAQEAHDLPEKTRKKKADAALAQRVTTVILENGMTGWDDLPRAELFALDAPTTEVRFRYNGEEHRFTSDQELPDGGWIAVREILGLLEEAAG